MNKGLILVLRFERNYTIHSEYGVDISKTYVLVMYAKVMHWRGKWLILSPHNAVPPPDTFKKAFRLSNLRLF